MWDISFVSLLALSTTVSTYCGLILLFITAVVSCIDL